MAAHVTLVRVLDLKPDDLPPLPPGMWFIERQAPADAATFGLPPEVRAVEQIELTDDPCDAAAFASPAEAKAFMETSRADNNGVKVPPLSSLFAYQLCPAVMAAGAEARAIQQHGLADDVKASMKRAYREHNPDALPGYVHAADEFDATPVLDDDEAPAEDREQIAYSFRRIRRDRLDSPDA